MSDNGTEGEIQRDHLADAALLRATSTATRTLLLSSSGDIKIDYGP